MTFKTAFSFSETKKLFEAALEKEFLFGFSENQLSQACRYALLSGGKRIRPLITYMLSHAIGKGFDVKEAALSVEYFHTASLIADDLPCMDNDSMRRDKPSLHIAFNEATALLASYALITAAFEKIHQATKILSERVQNAEKIGLLALHEASTLAGFCGATGGQFEDLFVKPKSLNDLLESNKKKTVTLFQVAFIFGWLFGGGDIRKISTIKSLAHHFGMAFQIADDLEDIKQDQIRKNSISIVNYVGEESATKMLFTHLQQVDFFKKELGCNLEAINSLQEKIASKVKIPAAFNETP